MLYRKFCACDISQTNNYWLLKTKLFTICASVNCLTMSLSFWGGLFLPLVSPSQCSVIIAQCCFRPSNIMMCIMYSFIFALQMIPPVMRVYEEIQNSSLSKKRMPKKHETYMLFHLTTWSSTYSAQRYSSFFNILNVFLFLSVKYSFAVSFATYISESIKNFHPWKRSMKSLFQEHIH